MARVPAISRKSKAIQRTFDTKLREGGLKQSFWNSIRQSDTKSSIIKNLADNGINVSQQTLERHIFNNFSYKTAKRYFQNTSHKVGTKNGFSKSLLKAIAPQGRILVQVRGISKDGQERIFDTYVNVDQDSNFESIEQQIREIYEENSKSNISPLTEVSIN